MGAMAFMILPVTPISDDPVAEVRIYALLHPVTKEVVYVGQTGNLTKRLYSHLHRAGNPRLRAWIRSLQAEGMQPEAVIIDCCSKARADKVERAWIWRLSQRAELFNIAIIYPWLTEQRRPAVLARLERRQTRARQRRAEYEARRPSVAPTAPPAPKRGLFVETTWFREPPRLKRDDGPQFGLGLLAARR